MDEAMVCAALAALADGPRHTAREALEVVPNEAGLYAVHGDLSAVGALALGAADRPLYVGKAERSLVGRDLRTHFATGRTGSSTLRRTLAALLREPLGLRAVPRNPALPDGSANYSLESSGDERLTEWMHARLRLSVWVRPDGVVLDEVETAMLDALRPPLNLAKMGSLGDRRVKAARAAMAEEARAWREA
ncbi:GIY-YIG nuclease family protein [Streptomyces pristinaespiralis]|uniref:GIY-YIG nuclease family protein n=1 Tax=Streptomyces pristinaespiralis TaxID=38300 RepID=UPI003832B0B6